MLYRLFNVGGSFVGTVDVPAGVKVLSGSRRTLSGDLPAPHEKWQQDAAPLSPAKRVKLDRPVAAPRNRQLQLGQVGVEVDSPSPLRTTLSPLCAVDCPLDVAVIAAKALSATPDSGVALTHEAHPGGGGGGNHVVLLGPLSETEAGRPLWAARDETHLCVLDPVKCAVFLDYFPSRLGS